MAIVEAAICICNRCAHRWLPEREDQLPRRCAKCKTPAWNRDATSIKQRNGWVEPGYVYLMLDEALDCHKIGFAFAPQARERTLQAEKPTIRLVESWRGTKRDERMLHARFADWQDEKIFEIHSELLGMSLR